MTKNLNETTKDKLNQESPTKRQLKLIELAETYFDLAVKFYEKEVKKSTKELIRKAIEGELESIKAQSEIKDTQNTYEILKENFDKANKHFLRLFNEYYNFEEKKLASDRTTIFDKEPSLIFLYRLSEETIELLIQVSATISKALKEVNKKLKEEANKGDEE